MEFLGIGPSELLFVVIIALIVLGPKDMQKAGRTIGKWMRDIVTSEGWKVFQQTSNELRKLPSQMMRDANEELDKFNRDLKADIDLNKLTQKSPPRSVSVDSPNESKPTPNLPPSEEQENTIRPPSPKPLNNPAQSDEPENTIQPPSQDPSTDESAEQQKHD